MLTTKTIKKYFPKLDKETVKAISKATGCSGDHGLHEINQLLGFHGVEVIRGDRFDRYWGDTVGVNANSGDSYALTVWFFPPVDSWSKGRWVICDLEQAIKIAERRFKCKVY